MHRPDRNKWSNLALLLAFSLLAFTAQQTVVADAPDILIADFEGPDYGHWQVTGEAFGNEPAHGTLPNQMPVTGYLGKGLVNSYLRGDQSQGTLTSPDFKILRSNINFLIGGGYHPNETCINLLIDGKVVRTATGKSRTPQDTERLTWATWNVAEFNRRNAQIQIVDKHSGGWGHINIDQIVQSDHEPAIPTAQDEKRELLTQAMASMQANLSRAEADPTRPIYHFHAPANWMNDPNGPLFHHGYYHMFYQFNPYGDNWGNMHWGHARSRDLVHWEQLPIALWPSRMQGEEHIYSGCSLITPTGKPMIIYTSIGHPLPEQWAALSDDDMIDWQKLPANPLLTETLHGKTKVYDWRDPFYFEDKGHHYLVAGGNLNEARGGEAIVNLYEAGNDELTQWKYLGVLFKHPDASIKNIECPNFFKLGNRWVLAISPYGPVQYFIGDFDATTHQFTATRHGTMDFSDAYYAPNCLLDQQGRRVMWGWVKGFKEGHGWNGCLTVPHILTLSKEGELHQEPAPELQTLRGESFHKTEMPLQAGKPFQSELKGDTLEILAEIEPGTAAASGLKLRQSDDGRNAVTIAYDGNQLDVAGTKLPFKLHDNEKTLQLHILLDKSVMEVFINHRECVTKVIYPEAADLGVSLFANGGQARVKSLDIWRIKSIW
ncbi:Glycosyl hydrolase family 32 domain protein [Pedosphaera parvula Ellin514]|uniref:beta-fructofuranosidase n=2 Tax=Pedosphaera TaxID=1032526 RepID=B9XHD2_PEDPL|nr:Glycosyl hydrolase family 32 domain protein [Pedosphaera parvula Ellin514]